MQKSRLLSLRQTLSARLHPQFAQIVSDKALIAILGVALALGLCGIHWGRVESWHPDQMAFRPLFREGKGPLNPAWFRKPPLFTYIEFFLSVAPTAAAKKAGFPTADVNAIRLVWSGALNVFMFMGTCLFLYLLIHDSFGRPAARVLTAIFGTSAGFLVFAHFLTPDTSVALWMLIAFYFCYRILSTPDLRTYVLAGVFTGVATATKYNGLGIGVAIAIAHLLVWVRRDRSNWRTLVLSRNLFTALASVALAFVVCNPYAVLDYRTFLQDFIYNYTVTPVFAGASGETSYLRFFLLSKELFGYPVSLFLLVAVCFSLYSMAKGHLPSRQQDLLILSFGTFGVYFVEFGGFSFLETRFVMPIYPLLLIAAGLLVQRLSPRHVYALATPLVLYGILCSIYVGKRLSDDPRMHAQEWVRKNVPPNSTIERTPYTPDFTLLKGSTVTNVRAPFVTGRHDLFAPLFADDPEMIGRMEMLEKNHNLSWYTCAELMRRLHEYVAIDSLYYERFLEDSLGDFHPLIKKHFRDLLAGAYPYHIVFDEGTPKPEWWLYPKEIDALENRMTILQRNDSWTAECGDPGLSTSRPQEPSDQK